MAKLMDVGRLIGHPTNVPVWLEIRHIDGVSFEHCWEYIADANALRMIGRKDLFGIESWNRVWRCWNAKPTMAQRNALAWRR